MKIQLKKIVENLQHYSKKLDNYAILTEQPWITKTENNNERFVIIFRKNKDLLISINGKVEKGKWDYIPSMNSLIIERDTGTTLYNQGFFDDSVMILKVDGTDDYQVFANENKIESTIEKLVQDVERKYLVAKWSENKTENPSYNNRAGINPIFYENPTALEENGEINEELIGSITNFWGNNIIQYRITFKSCGSGFLFKDGKGFNIIDETGSNNFYYCDKASAIYSLYTLLKTNKVSYIGYKSWK